MEKHFLFDKKSNRWVDCMKRISCFRRLTRSYREPKFCTDSSLNSTNLEYLIEIISHCLYAGPHLSSLPRPIKTYEYLKSGDSLFIENLSGAP